MKKGFTMIELLGVFTVLGIILLISLPQITSTLKKSEEQEYETYQNSIYIACEEYITDKNISVPTTITIKDLIESGFLKSTTVNPKNDKTVSDTANKNKIITITKNDDNVLEYQLEG